MRIFVTGGSGFLGKVIIRHLLEKGHEVYALARSNSALATVEALGATGVKGDLQFVEGSRAVLLQTDAVIHCAAPVEFWGPWSRFREGITDATARLAHLAEECGVKRFIYISSESALQAQGPLLDIDESHPMPDEPSSDYGKAKMLAEKHLLGTDFKMTVVILRPTFIWGDDCPALTLIESKVRSGSFLWIDGGQSPFEAVHVQNVAVAATSALSKGRDKGVYFITDGEKATVRQFFSDFFEARGLVAPKLSIPVAAAKLAARVLESVWKTLRLPGAPPVTRFDVAFMSQPRRYNTQISFRELGYRSVVSRRDGWKQLSRTFLNAP